MKLKGLSGEAMSHINLATQTGAPNEQIQPPHLVFQSLEKIRRDFPIIGKYPRSFSHHWNRAAGSGGDGERADGF
ncbi:MAG TPA: hypothetical protein P5567_15220 [Kiritimatiellia bacterium]|nr:hypothetical protein [Kiritimatiellia bacterium]HSA19413.1 hypothetical protein [Kiritimatiellia bacterium]